MEIGNDIFIKQMSAYMQRVDESGILSRFLSCFGYDWTTFIKPLIEQQTDIHNPYKSKDLLGEIMGMSPEELQYSNNKFLTLIGNDLGSPIDITPMPTGDESMVQTGPDKYPDIYKKILIFIVSLYKMRGTALAIKYWGYLLGLDIDVVIINRPRVMYDSGFNYDEIINTSEITQEKISYDMNICESCTQFYLRTNHAIYTGQKFA